MDRAHLRHEQQRRELGGVLDIADEAADEHGHGAAGGAQAPGREDDVDERALGEGGGGVRGVRGVRG